MASNWISVNLQLGYPAPGNVDDSALVPIGTIAQFRDTGTTYLGVGEFIYLKGIGSTVLGSVVSYKQSDGTAAAGTTALWAGTVSTGYPLAVATAAIVADKYGWYQISGAAICKTTGTIADGDSLYYGAAGTLQNTPVAGKQVIGAQATSANGVPAANQAIVTLNRPAVQSQYGS